MGKVLLTDTQCQKATELVGVIRGTFGQIDSSINSINFAINDGTINQWITDTAVGVQEKTKVEHNMESMAQLKASLEMICNATENLVRESEIANQAS